MKPTTPMTGSAVEPCVASRISPIRPARRRRSSTGSPSGAATRPYWITRERRELGRRHIRVVGTGHRVEHVVRDVEPELDEARTDDRQDRRDEVERAMRRRDQDAEQDRHEGRGQERQPSGPQGQEPERQLRLDRRAALHRERVEVLARLPDRALGVLEEGNLGFIPAPGGSAGGYVRTATVAGPQTVTAALVGKP